MTADSAMVDLIVDEIRAEIVRALGGAITVSDIAIDVDMFDWTATFISGRTIDSLDAFQVMATIEETYEVSLSEHLDAATPLTVVSVATVIAGLK